MFLIPGNIQIILKCNFWHLSWHWSGLGLPEYKNIPWKQNYLRLFPHKIWFWSIFLRFPMVPSHTFSIWQLLQCFFYSFSGLGLPEYYQNSKRKFFKYFPHNILILEHFWLIFNGSISYLLNFFTCFECGNPKLGSKKFLWLYFITLGHLFCVLLVKYCQIVHFSIGVTLEGQCGHTLRVCRMNLKPHNVYINMHLLACSNLY